MNRSTLYAVLAAAVVLIGGLSYALYQEQQKKSGIEISVGNKGVAIETK